MAEIYGTTWLETARDKIKALLDMLKTAMASGYSPTFSYVYERHNTAKLQLNAVSVGLQDAVEGEKAASNNVLEKFIVPFTLRVHTAYSGGVQDDQKNARLLNSIVNKLLANYNLGDGYRIEDVTDISASEEFADSHTLGGQMTVYVRKEVNYTQE